MSWSALEEGQHVCTCTCVCMCTIVYMVMCVHIHLIMCTMPYIHMCDMLPLQKESMCACVGTHESHRPGIRGQQLGGLAADKCLYTIVCVFICMLVQGDLLIHSMSVDTVAHLPVEAPSPCLSPVEQTTLGFSSQTHKYWRTRDQTSRWEPLLNLDCVSAFCPDRTWDPTNGV